MSPSSYPIERGSWGTKKFLPSCLSRTVIHSRPSFYHLWAGGIFAQDFFSSPPFLLPEKEGTLFSRPKKRIFLFLALAMQTLLPPCPGFPCPPPHRSEGEWGNGVSMRSAPSSSSKLTNHKRMREMGGGRVRLSPPLFLLLCDFECRLRRRQGQ